MTKLYSLKLIIESPPIASKYVISFKIFSLLPAIHNIPKGAHHYTKLSSRRPSSLFFFYVTLTLKFSSNNIFMSPSCYIIISILILHKFIHHNPCCKMLEKRNRRILEKPFPQARPEHLKDWALKPRLRSQQKHISQTNLTFPCVGN